MIWVNTPKYGSKGCSTNSRILPLVNQDREAAISRRIAGDCKYLKYVETKAEGFPSYNKKQNPNNINSYFYGFQ